MLGKFIVGRKLFEIVVLLIMLRSLFDIVYFNVVSPYYAYAGFINNMSWESFVVSLLAFSLSLPFVVLIIYNSQERVSAFIVEVLYIFSYIPFTTCIFAGIFPEREYIFLNVLYWIILLCAEIYFLYRQMQERVVVITIDKFRFNNELIAVFAVISLFTVIFVSWWYTGFRLNFDLMNVYELRLGARDFNMSMTIAYLLSWAGIINPLMLGYCLMKKHWCGVGLFFFTQILCFGIAGHKSVLMAPFLVIGMIIVCHNVSMQKIKLYILYAFCSINFLGIVEYVICSSFWIIAIFIRRLCFIPNHIAYNYYDFFISNSFDWFRGSFLRHFGFLSPYSELGISRTIGSIYYNAGNNANNGLFSDAWSNMGYIGVIFMPVILISILYFVDRCTAGLNAAFISAVGALQGISLLSTNLFTVLMTHGVLICCFIFLLLKRDENKCHT